MAPAQRRKPATKEPAPQRCDDKGASSVYSFGLSRPWAIVILLAVAVATALSWHLLDAERRPKSAGRAASRPTRESAEGCAGILQPYSARPATAEEALLHWATSCGSEECKLVRLQQARDPAWLFHCARGALLDREAEGEAHRMALLLLRRAASLEAATAWNDTPVLDQELPCRRPADSTAGKLFNERLLSQPLVEGRVCKGGACHRNRCVVVILDDVVSLQEADALIQHGRTVLDRQVKTSGKQLRSKANKNRKDLEKPEVHLVGSARHGQKDGHVLLLYVMERLRQLMSLVADVPAQWVHVESQFLAYVEGEEAAPDYVYSIHCDEGSFDRFHFSGVLWLTAHDHESGGTVAFWDADRRAWRRDAETQVGRAAFFSSGWENIHRVQPLRRGERWSLPIFVSIKPRLNATQLVGECLWPSGIQQWKHCEENLHHLLSAADGDFA